ncbi:hypothetical protein SAY86_023613 [Trapa natans]|uniref:Uncharacterized protein n=1 Tax=Trapa natans TaxID=22666 RepID=A0AAN7M807_TRANT|nr:hypothetical protein SAY86_023613 [Trapa natans]
MHPWDARRLSTPSFISSFEHQKLLQHLFKPKTDVSVEGGSRQSLLTWKVTESDLSTAGEVTAGPGSRDCAVDDDALDAVGNDRVGENGAVLVMDYAQPHRKPPIHNEKPRKQRLHRIL